MRQISKFICVALVFALTLSFSACGKTAQETASSGNNTLNVKTNGWMNLTQEQYNEDFEYLYREMKENYPYFGVSLRKNDVDIDKTYTEYSEKIKTCADDESFVKLVEEFVAELKYLGHISMLGYDWYEDTLNRMLQLVEQQPENKNHFSKYIEKLQDPVAQKNYKAMREFYDNKSVEDSKITSSQMLSNTSTEEAANVETKILRDGQIAYAKINAFDMSSFASDKEILLPFYDSVIEYDNIIIDITENGGGGMSYFDELVVSPLITKQMSTKAYVFAKDGANNRYFMNFDRTGWKSVDMLPALPNMNADDLKELDYFSSVSYTVSPMIREKAFEGKVWLLVSARNYSSSEYAAMFSKHSGFATLVGENTGGDGIGTDPVYFVLPNSGLIVQYGAIYGVSEDGTGSEEFGTKPDILIQEGETALDACLKAIDAK